MSDENPILLQQPDDEDGVALEIIRLDDESRAAIKQYAKDMRIRSLSNAGQNLIMLGFGVHTGKYTNIAN
jgi:hypothetical protein